MKIKWKSLGLCIVIPLAIGGLAGLISHNSMQEFASLKQPPLSPPGWLFPVVWSTLYTLMGIASYLVINSDASSQDIKKSLKLYGWQLLFNFFWTIWFFNLQWFYFAFLWIVILWILVAATTVSFSHQSKAAAYLLIPYLLWITFAAYLNLGVAILN